MSIMPQVADEAIWNGSQHDQSTSEVVHKILMLQRKAISQEDNESKLITSFCNKKSAHARKFVENIYFQLFITLFTVASLFMEDIRVIGISSQYDNIVDGINIMFIIVFMAEILLSLSIPGYPCSFFFFLDILSTLSIIMDISILTNLLYTNNLMSSGIKLNVLVRNSKASRAAARTVRVMKIFRLARIVKLYKSAMKTNELKTKKNKQAMKEKLKSLKLKKIKQAEKQLENKSSYRNISSQGGSRNQFVSGQISIHNDLSVKEIQDNIQTLKQLQIDNKIDACNQNTSTIQLAQEIQEQKEEEKVSESFEQVASEMSKTESKISKLLSENTMKKIIIMILLIMFSVPVLQIDNYYQDTSAWDFLATFIANAFSRQNITIDAINNLIIANIQTQINSLQTDQTLVIFSTPFKQIYSYDSGQFNSLRINDIMVSQVTLNVSQILQVRNSTLTLNYKEGDIQKNAVTIILSCNRFNIIDSWFSIGKILFICLIIVYLLNNFNNSITQLITEPIERMLDQVKQNGKSNIIQFDEHQENQENLQKKKNEVSSNTMVNYETQMVQKTLNKISCLISKIFGSRGKQLIYKKIFEKGSVISNYLSQNKRVYCILGLCSIENYHKISSILKANVLQLNNQIAHYLHSAVYRYGGRGVMNYEDSFLVVFQCPPSYQHCIQEEQYKRKGKSKPTKFNQEKNVRCANILSKPKRKMISDQKYKHIKVRQNKNINFENAKIIQNQYNNYLNVFADFSVFAMVKTLVKINKESKFYKYRKLPSVAKGLEQNFQIKINCMLHAGWVEQGFLGTSFKMDYCYFGEPINELKKMAYHCHKLPNSLFMSQNMYNIITPGMKKYTRVVGNCENLRKQTELPLYMVDLNLQNISLSKNAGKADKHDHDISSVTLKKMLNFQCLRDEQQITKYKASAFINVKKQLREVLRNVISEQFRKKYLQAYELYVNEEYLQSKQILDQLYTFNKDDPPVSRLLHLIQNMQANKKSYFTREEELDWLTW